ncbi:Scr1 family TA system antitoxin-like transcriptional regulator [Micromonospora sp. DT62]|uniref:Scr1 family TA system antitoxin-like transcriptional regulator n=1 Tax=Micromonospora sp. DT62 TaxID=3416521 RepID=UPI003CE7D150
MNYAVIEAMTAAGLTADNLAAEIGVDPKTAARWANPGHIPQSRHRAKVANLLGREVLDLWPGILKRREPVWLRQWVDWERAAVALKWFELAWVPGLFQTKAYAQATLAGEPLSTSELDELVEARLNRQAVLHRERPPLLIAVMDEAVLWRAVDGDRELMREQCEHLAACARLPSVQVYVVPSSVGMYPGLGGPLILAELPEGEQVAHVDSQARAEVISETVDVAKLVVRWERIRGEALSRAQSLDLITKAAEHHGSGRRAVA